MAAGSLFHPDNRMLGGFTHDFSLFGGQPDPGVTVGPAQSPLTAPDEVQPGANLDGTPPASDETPASSDPVTDRGMPDEASIGTSPTVGGHQPSPDIPIATEVPAQQPTSGTPTAPDVLASLAPPGSAHGALGAGDAASPTDGQSAIVADQVGEGIIPLLGSLTTDGVALAGFAANTFVQPVTATLGEVGHLGASAVHGLTTGLDLAATAIDGGIAQVGHTVSTVTGDAAATIDTVAAAASDPLTHGLDNLGGGDPAGGVATLVGMVNTVDQFAVSAAAPAHTAEPTGSIVDDLIADGGAGLFGDGGGHDAAHLTDADHTLDHVL